VVRLPVSLLLSKIGTKSPRRVLKKSHFPSTNRLVATPAVSSVSAPVSPSLHLALYLRIASRDLVRKLRHLKKVDMSRGPGSKGKQVIRENRERPAVPLDGDAAVDRPLSLYAASV
jgi:hypothetical protein